MNAKIPSPNDLIYFVEVANLLNLSRAAECLGISQPSLTLSMRRLEETVGTPVLNRHKHGVSLTKAGQQLLAHVRQLLQQWESIRSEALASIQDIQGCFTIGCHPSVAIYSLPLFLKELMQNYPKLEIKLQHDLSRKISEQVININIDIGIVVNPTKHPDLIIKHLGEDKITLWHSPLEHKIQDLDSGEAILLCDLDLMQTQAILKEIKKRKIHYARLISSSSLELLAELTQNGCGVGILPGNVAIPRNLINIPKAPFYKDEICLLYRGENRNVKAIQIITEMIKKVFQN